LRPSRRIALAQTSPFLTGATALQSNILAWLTPIAIILIMVLGGMAMANRMLSTRVIDTEKGCPAGQKCKRPMDTGCDANGPQSAASAT
jgi:hypothetical protein